jgi:hypothetical protein
MSHARGEERASDCRADDRRFADPAQSPACVAVRRWVNSVRERTGVSGVSATLFKVQPGRESHLGAEGLPTPSLHSRDDPANRIKNSRTLQRTVPITSQVGPSEMPFIGRCLQLAAFIRCFVTRRKRFESGTDVSSLARRGSSLATNCGLRNAAGVSGLQVASS